MNYSDNLKTGTVVINYNYYKYGGFIPVYLIFGISEKEYKETMEKLKFKVSKSYMQYEHLLSTVTQVRITGVIIGYVFVDKDGMVYTNGSFSLLQDMIKRILSGQIDIESYNITEDLYENKTYYVINELSVREKAIENFLIKRKMVNQNAVMYTSLDSFKQEARQLIHTRKEEFDTLSDLKRIATEIVKGEREAKSVEQFVTGNIILRCTEHRFRAFLVLNSATLVELVHGTRENVDIRLTLSTLKTAIKGPREKAKQPDYYWQTGVNVYPLIKEFL